MKTTRITATMVSLAIGLVCLGTGLVQAESYGTFRDDFINPDPTNQYREPVQWRPNGGSVVIENGDLTITDDAVVPEEFFFADDVAVEAQFQILAGNSAGVALRIEDNRYCYWGYAGSNQPIGEPSNQTYAGIGKCRGGIINFVPVNLDLQKDVAIRLQAVGNQLSLWAWPPDEPRPENPTVTAQDSDHTEGNISVWVAHDAGGPAQAAFRYVEAVVIGDCNGDGVLDAADLSCVSSVAGRDAVLRALNTFPGDLDGNGDVSFTDFLVFSSNFGQDLPSYADGNINLEDGVNFADFLVLTSNYGAAANRVAEIPEPAGWLTAALGGALLMLLRRRS